MGARRTPQHANRLRPGVAVRRRGVLSPLLRPPRRIRRRSRKTVGLLVQFTLGRATVASVMPGSPGERAGVRPGNRILRFIDRPVTSRLDWSGIEANLPVGGRLLIDVERDGQPLHLAASDTLGSQWTSHTPRTIALRVSRAVQLLCLALAAIVPVEPHDRTARLAAWTLASLGVYTVVLPAGIAHHWRHLPLPAAVADVAALREWDGARTRVLHLLQRIPATGAATTDAAARERPRRAQRGVAARVRDADRAR